MEIVKISILMLSVIFITGAVPSFNKEISLIVTVSCCIVVLLYTVNSIVPTVEYLKNLIQSLAFEEIDIVIKAVGIGFITQFVSDIAVDCNNKTLANLMVFAGRAFILMLAMPVILQIFEIMEYLI